MNNQALTKYMRAYITPLLRKAFETAKDEGCTCPLCGQYAKVYKRKINAGMAADLLRLYRLNVHGMYNDYHHYTKFCNKSGGGDFAKLVYWGLIESKPHTQDDKKSSGYWAITQRGIDFAEGKITVIERKHIYNGEMCGESGGQVTIRDALGKNFNYSELMNA